MTALVSRLLVAVFLLAGGTGYVPPAGAAQLLGQVLDRGDHPVTGAMVSTTDLNAPKITTAYTDGSGHFSLHIEEGSSTPTVLRVAKLGYGSVEVGPDDDGFYRSKLTAEPGNLSAVPASAWFAGLPKDEGLRVTMMQCVGCHQFPSPNVVAFAKQIEGLPDDQRRAAWHSMISYMSSMIDVFLAEASDGSLSDLVGLGVDTGEKDEVARVSYVQDGVMSEPDKALIAEYLTKHMPTNLDWAAHQADQVPELSLGAEVQEFPIRPDNGDEKPGMLHDVMVAKGPGGKMYGWGAEVVKNALVRVDPENGEQKWYYTPDRGLGDHTIVPDSSGNLWITLETSAQVARFNPFTEQWRLYSNFSAASMPHSFGNDYKFEMGFDRQGRLWTTLNGANRLASLDPESGEVEEFDMPKLPDDSPFYTALYSAAMESDKTHLWFTQVSGEALGCFNTETREVEFLKRFPKGTSPRRFAIDQHDVLWIPLYGASQLLAFDTQTRTEIGRYDLPDSNATPYSLSWDYKREVVWIEGTNSDLIYRFDPKTETFAQLRLPRTGAFMRSLPVDPESGALWSSYSNLPGVPDAPYMMVQIKPGQAQ